MRGSLAPNIDDLIQEREWELRHEVNWIDVEGDDFMREYLHLPSPPPPRRPALRERAELIFHLFQGFHHLHKVYKWVKI